MLDITIHPMDIQLAAAEEHLEVVVVTGTLLPTPQGTLPLPTHQYRIPFTKQLAYQMADKIREVADSLPDHPKKPSDLIVANSMAGIDKAAQEINKFK